LEVLAIFNCYADMLCISAITEAELLHGAEKSQQREHNLRQMVEFLSRLEVLPYTSKATSHYGDIRANVDL
jgi:tRNA(fMet)-specific endonuclease VapC